jgi:site-specific DNA recombinase
MPSKPNSKNKKQNITKLEQIVIQLNRNSGVSIPELVKTTGWQAHSIRSFMSAALKLTNDRWLLEILPTAPTLIPKLIQASKSLADAILDKTKTGTHPVRKLIDRVTVEKSRITINLNRSKLYQQLVPEENIGLVPKSERKNQPFGAEDGLIQIILQSHLLRCGKQMKLILGTDASGDSTPNPQLINLVVQSKQWFAGLSNGRYSSLSDVAKGVSLDKSYVSRLITLAFLSPDILEKIVTGDHSRLLTPERLRKSCPLPLRWEEQSALLQL